MSLILMSGLELDSWGTYDRVFSISHLQFLDGTKNDQEENLLVVLLFLQKVSQVPLKF